MVLYIHILHANNMFGQLDGLTAQDAKAHRERLSHCNDGNEKGVSKGTSTCCISRIRIVSQGHQSQQRRPDVPLPRHLLQLLWGEPKAFPGQPRDIVPPACPGP
ncbi:hypothetical protein AMECASPLE_027949 [Ameca splendens]|uniref:Uncharacterized protein n=1 Tax=Ameca splendens TaxID=208324 RepID=A0ABV0YHL0_9TELE